MIEPDLLHRLATSFGGVTAYQTWADFFLWELVLNDRPDVRAIVEIGTAEGGFSRYLNAQAEARAMRFWTFDAVMPEKSPPGFMRLDVFANAETVGALLQEYEPVILLCDGGNKPREVKTFGPLLHKGSLVVVHDWMTEFQPEDAPPELEMVYTEVCDTLGSMSRIYEPREEA